MADRHVLVLEASIHARTELVGNVVDNLEPDELTGIEMILMVDGDTVVQCYPSTA